MRTRHDLVFCKVLTSTYARYSINAGNIIKWKRNFKKNIVKKNLGERTTKEVDIIKIKSYFSVFTEI